MSDGRCIIVCRPCSTDAEMIALVPFGSYAERGKWAAEHRNATGHDSWLCLDGWLRPDDVREMLFPAFAPVDWPARFRKAADVAAREGFIDVSDRLVDFAEWAERDQAPVRHVVEAIGRELTGDES